MTKYEKVAKFSNIDFSPSKGGNISLKNKLFHVTHYVQYAHTFIFF